MANHRLNLNVGDKFGRLTIICCEGANSLGKYMYRCRCDCGNTLIVMGSNLNRGRIVSCGCKKRENARNSRGFHGHTKESIYNIWGGMLQRCGNAKLDGFKNYGGRGILVCEEWKNFKNFYSWAIKNGYEENKNLSIERIDVNGDYCPKNCKFIDKAKQCMNKQNTLWYKGENLKSACIRLGINYTTVHSRIRKGMDVEKAVETSLNKEDKNGSR